MHNDNQNGVEPVKFTQRELQVFVALLGTFSVCGLAAYLGDVRALWGLVAIMYIVREMAPVEGEDDGDNPEI